MKIHIEVELEANEIPLATELLSTLRSLTDHVNVTTTTPPPSAPPPAVSSAPILPPAPVAQAPVVQAAVAQAAVAQAPVPQAPIPPQNLSEAIKNILIKLADESNQESAIAELLLLLQHPGTDSQEKVIEDFLAAFEAVALNLALVTQNMSVAPYMVVLPRLPDEDKMKTKIRDRVISKVLQHLTKKRAVDVDRAKFFAHAEAFAVLVKLDFVTVDGAAQTIEKMLSKVETRSAAVTMLGKTVELCADKLITCKPAFLELLWKALSKVTEANFKYDVDYIQPYLTSILPVAQAQAASAAPLMPPGPSSTPAGPDMTNGMHPPAHTAAPAGAAMPESAGYPPAANRGGPPGSVPVPAAVPGPVSSMVPRMRLEGHTKSLFAVCYDAQRKAAITAGKDTFACVWSENSIVATLDMQQHQVCACDVHARHNMLLMAGVAAETHPGTQPALYMYDAARSWALRTMLHKPSLTMISCLKCLSDGDLFATGETLSSPTGESQLVCIYDVGRSANTDTLVPIQTCVGHDELVTCVTAPPGSTSLVISGSKDRGIRAWDARAPTCVGQFGVHDPASTRVVAHNDIITHLDCTTQNLVISAALDCYLLFWDLRMLGSQTSSIKALHAMGIDNEPVLRVATSGASAPNIAVVSTLKSMYLVDFNNFNSVLVTPAVMFPDVKHYYHDVRWAPGQGLVYAIGDSPHVDVFQVS